MAPGSYDKLMSASASGKNVGVSELRKITLVASLGKINNVGSVRAQKFRKGCAWGQRQINERLRVLEKCYSLRIAQNRTSSIIRQYK